MPARPAHSPTHRPTPLIPAPVSVAVPDEAPFLLTGGTPILTETDDAEAARIGRLLADLVGPVRDDLFRTPAEIAAAEPAERPSEVVLLRIDEAEALGAGGATCWK